MPAELAIYRIYQDLFPPEEQFYTEKEFLNRAFKAVSVPLVDHGKKGVTDPILRVHGADDSEHFAFTLNENIAAFIIARVVAPPFESAPIEFYFRGGDVLIKNESDLNKVGVTGTSEFVVIEYLGVSKNFQNGGHGTEVLSYVKNVRFADQPLVVELEKPETAGTHAQFVQRLKREFFYLKNGLRRAAVNYVMPAVDKDIPASEDMCLMSTKPVRIDVLFKAMYFDLYEDNPCPLPKDDPRLTLQENFGFENGSTLEGRYMAKLATFKDGLSADAIVECEALIGRVRKQYDLFVSQQLSA